MDNSLPTRNDLKKGISVSIVEKHNQETRKKSVGTIDKILTNSEIHPHGIKVRLTDGKVGRVKSILKKSKKEE